MAKKSKQVLKKNGVASSRKIKNRSVKVTVGQKQKDPNNERGVS